MVRIWFWDKVFLYPSFGGVGGCTSLSGLTAFTLHWRKLDRLERALYSGKACMSFSFCCRSVSSRLVDDRVRDVLCL